MSTPVDSKGYARFFSDLTVLLCEDRPPAVHRHRVPQGNAKIEDTGTWASSFQCPSYADVEALTTYSTARSTATTTLITSYGYDIGIQWGTYQYQP